ncbi:protein kinase domain-containing protein [Arthrobacter ruber]|uniref:protein kinase domain-containing protein n=1 Tax=Arthrobacter ruber TaxID=1258893 RepID=UPI000CF5161F|nr:protein kinase [Arthrobacter ruber]
MSDTRGRFEAHRHAGLERCSDNGPDALPDALSDAPEDELLPLDPDEDAERPRAEGLRVGRLLGRGGTSSVWLVTDDGGRRFALKVRLTRHAEPAAARRPTASPGPASHGRRAAAPRDPVPAPPSWSSVGRPRPPETDPSGTAGRRAASELSEGPDGVEDRGDLEQELCLLQRFAHQHLVGVHRLIDTDRGPGLLMDLALGGSLLGLVTSRGPLPVSEVVTALVPVAQVLDHLHGAGALHGDVTPANILFTHEGKPLLGDFGTARLLGSADGAVMGTAGFIDPARGGSFDAGADVFALAAVAWFALTGRVPGPTEQRPPLALIVPEVPPQLMQLIEDGLDADSERRPTPDRFARTLLVSARPEPVDLAGAVHASVLPELLTRRTDTTPAAPRSGVRRILARRGTGRTGFRSPAAAQLPTDPSAAGRRAYAGRPSSREPREAWGRGSAGPSRRPTRHGATGHGPHGSSGRWIRVVGVVAGLAALVLLVAGVALTSGGFAAPGTVSVGTGRAGAGAPDSSPSSSEAGGTPRDGTGEGSVRVTPADMGPVGTSAPDDGQRPPDPTAALMRLAALRATAFTTADPAVLADIDVEGSPAMAADREAVTALAGTGRRLSDLSITIRDPAVIAGADLEALPAVRALPAVASPPPATDVAVLRATAALSSYTETDAEADRGAGPMVTADTASPDEHPGPLMAAGRQELIFILWESGPGWRIHTVVTAPE